MARPTKNVDIKILFPQFNMLPGPAGKRFQRDLLLHGGKTDTQGYSISDCFLRVDAYAASASREKAWSLATFRVCRRRALPAWPVAAAGGRAFDLTADSHCPCQNMMMPLKAVALDGGACELGMASQTPVRRGHRATRERVAGLRELDERARGRAAADKGRGSDGRALRRIRSADHLASASRYRPGARRPARPSRSWCYRWKASSQGSPEGELQLPHHAPRRPVHARPHRRPAVVIDYACGDADLAWAKPLFCDVTVHLAARDMKTKTGPTGADGCFLGHDFIRGCEFVYVPSLRRLSSPQRSLFGRMTQSSYP
jgi:hypothetical protein